MDAVFADMGASLIVIFNGLRLLHLKITENCFDNFILIFSPYNFFFMIRFYV